ncbi:uncharacterized protein [Atheta coriaria]|uniref:uncharacterized protein n=1 Tax=Dalotia coriaria TaxID=877792 RepID=UPI0031F39D6A
MSTKDNQEFQNALQEIVIYAPLLPNPYDRVRCVEWVRRLWGVADDNLESSKQRNLYMQFLRIQVRNNFLHSVFLLPPPPENDKLSPLPEALGACLHRAMPSLPRTGPIAPMMKHSSPDGRAFISAQQISGGGVLCYLAVSPNGFDN